MWTCDSELSLLVRLGLESPRRHMLCVVSMMMFPERFNYGEGLTLNVGGTVPRLGGPDRIQGQGDSLMSMSIV